MFKHGSFSFNKLLVIVMNLYRYISINKLIDTIDNGLYLPTLPQFKDDHEGAVGINAPENEELIIFDGGKAWDKEEVIEFTKNFRKYVHASCWYTEEFENSLMWEAYNKNENAVRISVDAKKLEACFFESNKDSFLIQGCGKISYILNGKFDDDGPCELRYHSNAYSCIPIKFCPELEEIDTLTRLAFNEIFRRSFLKIKEFRDEKGFRLAVAFKRDYIEGIKRVNIRNIISEIVAFPNASSEFILTLENITKKNKLRSMVCRSVL